ncbi:hypothetical protein MG5_04997 [Candida albicans P57072]|nr:hypothetical protein MEO_04944 [Candida albicans P94015]KGR03279.1 hypothetical protein MG5_04997 [Candida albicans P57072]KGU35672.1 hypothetical protein MGM_00675 [Candida albicans P75063]KHC30539.1 hypothetical protein MGO_04977 [Candida albicans P76055]KHC31109.1 hypothetical protein MGQ_04989 [Candida albicans P76067]KHC46834.1 hypothetical protein MEW_04977 [Candida albicans P60002]
MEIIFKSIHSALRNYMYTPSFGSTAATSGI